MSAPGAQPASAASGRAQGVVRRVIVFVILFALVTVAAIGLSGLVERAIGGTITLAGGTAALAQSLAFTFIGASAFSGAAGQLRGYSSGGFFVVAGDIDGDRVADFTIQVNTTISTTDLILV